MLCEQTGMHLKRLAVRSEGRIFLLKLKNLDFEVFWGAYDVIFVAPLSLSTVPVIRHYNV